MHLKSRQVPVPLSAFVVVIGFLLGIPIMAASMSAMYGYLGVMINLVLPTIVNPLFGLSATRTFAGKGIKPPSIEYGYYSYILL